MKLKKIASLMLAGIMAVSMLAACGEASSNGGNGGTGDVTPTSTYTSTIMGKTAATTQAILKSGSNTKLDQAVAYTAANCKYVDEANELTACYNGSDFKKVAQEFMGDAVYTDKMNDSTPKTNFTKLWGTDDVTVYTLLSIKRSYNDEYINNRVVEFVNELGSILVDKTENASGTYDYTINIAKADCLENKKEANADVDDVIIGIAVTLDYTKDTF